MGDMNLRAIADGYCRNIELLEKELTDLARRSSEIVKEAEDQKQAREAARAHLDALRRSQAALESERESIKAEFAEAQLENSTNKMQTLRKRNREVVAELEDIEGQISNAGELEPGDDLAQRAALLQAAKEMLEKRLPKPYYNTSGNLNPLLDGVGEVLQADAQRLRKWHTSIKVPAIYDKATIGKARAGAGKLYPLYENHLQEQENRRKEKMQRYEGVAGNTDAMHSAMRVSYREPEPTATTDADGRLSGDAVRAALAAKGA